MEWKKLIQERRSVRSYANRPIVGTILEEILQDTLLAPTWKNSETGRYYIVQDPELAAAVKEKALPPFNQKNCRNAPVLIVTANRKGYGNAMADSACVLENMMIAAGALGLGSCWINQLHWLDENQAVRAFLGRLRLEEGETITGGLILGYSADGSPLRGEPRQGGNPVTWI